METYIKEQLASREGECQTISEDLNIVIALEGNAFESCSQLLVFFL